ELGGQLVDLLCRHILACQEHVFVKRHSAPSLTVCHGRSRRQATRAFGKARTLEMREHGTPGRKTPPRGPLRPCGRPFSSRPGSSGSGFISASRQNTSRGGPGFGAGGRLTPRGGACLTARPPPHEEQMAVAFVFPGQGSQAVGMGRALAEA